MEASQIALSKIIRMPRNPKDHALDEINRSMERFGFLERVIVNRSTGHMIAGHGRVDTLQHAKVWGREPPEGIAVDKKTGEWLVPVDYVEVPEEEEEAAVIALNRLVEAGGWHDDQLAKMLSDLAAQGPEMLDGTGFDVDDLDALLKKLSPIERLDGELSEKEIGVSAQVIERWGVSEGDIWQAQGADYPHYIICGDSRELSTWQALLDTAGWTGVQACFTSPPYAEQRKDEYGGIPEDEYSRWWLPLQENVKKFLAEDGSFFVNIKPHSRDGERALYVMELVLDMVRVWGWAYVDEFCWERISAPGAWPNRFKNGFEPVHHFALAPEIKFRPRQVSSGVSGEAMGGANQAMGNYYNTAEKLIEWDSALPSNRISTKGNATGTGHAAAFPVGLPLFFIEAFSDKGDAWIDPFLGSGTTVVACEYAGRSGLGIETSPQYVAVSLERLDNLGLEIDRVAVVTADEN